MPVFTDICRICLQEEDYQELQEINIPKLNNLITSRPFMNFPYLQKWQTELFVNHLICITCIQHFRTIITIYRDSNRANNAIISEKNKRKITKVNLKRMAQFSDIEGDFLVCRLCLNTTMTIAIYLYDNSKNILPVEYIAKMLKHLKTFMNVNRTINPILCQKCWENIQVAYSFSKRLEVVTEKMFYYQALIDKIYINQEDLRDVLYMWDKLGVIDIKTEVDIVIKHEIIEENKPERKDLKPTIRKLERSPRVQNNCTKYYFYDEHNYFKVNEIINISDDKVKKKFKPIKTKRETTQRCVKESSSEMPLLKPNIEIEGECKEMPKLTPNIKTDINNIKGSSRLLRSQARFKENNQNKGKFNLNINNELPQQHVEPNWSKNPKKLKVSIETQELKKPDPNTAEEKPKDSQNKQVLEKEAALAVMQNIQEKSPNTSLKAKIRRIKKDEEVYQTDYNKNKKLIKKGKIVKASQKKQQDKTVKNTELLKLLTNEISRPTTRLSTKKEIPSNLYSQDLLVLRKEEIIKKKRQKRTLNASFPKHTSTPKLSKNKQNVSIPASEISPSKSISNSEYTFETLNLDEETHFKKEVIEEEELQIKRENLSECESDDDFTENTGCTTYDTADFEDECPNLESFIKSEPPDDSYMTDLDEEGPPELELQGPCQSVPFTMPRFTIHNTFTVDEKRNLINTVDEKRNLINILEEKGSSIKNSVDTGSSMNIIKDKSVFAPPLIKCDSFQTDQSKSKSNNERTRQETPFLKIKGDLFKPTSFPISTEKDRWSTVNENLTTNLAKSDAKATLTFEDKKEEDRFAGPSNINEANIEYVVYESPERSHHTQASKANLNQQANKSKFMQKCHICSFVSRRRGGLTRHINEVHMTTTPYFCQMCDFCSTSTFTITRHIKLHASNSLQLSKCEICTFASTRRNALKEHMMIKHQKELYGDTTYTTTTNLMNTTQKKGTDTSYTTTTNSINTTQEKGTDTDTTYTTTTYKIQEKKRKYEVWSQKELALLVKYFKYDLKNRTYPSNRAVQIFINETNNRRTVRAVKKKMTKLWLRGDCASADSLDYNALTTSREVKEELLNAFSR